MEKGVILKELETSRYFTNNYRDWWSKNIDDAHIFDPSRNTLSVSDRLEECGESHDNPFQNVVKMEEITIWYE